MFLYRLMDIVCFKCNKNIHEDIVFKNNRTYHNKCSRAVRIPKDNRMSWPTLRIRFMRDCKY